MPRSVSIVKNAQTLLPERFFQLSPAHVSTPGSPARHGMKRPEKLAGVRVPSSNVAVQTGARRLLAIVAAGDDDVLVDRRRRRKAEPAVDVASHAGFQIDRPVFAESGGRFSALRVDGQQSIAGAAEQPRRRLTIAGPIRDAAAADR